MSSTHSEKRKIFCHKREKAINILVSVYLSVCYCQLTILRTGDAVGMYQVVKNF